MGGDVEIERQIRALEERLLDARVRTTPGELDALLADDFVELGSSGRRFDKQQVIAALAGEPPTRYSLRDFELRRIAADVVLALYRGLAQPAGGEPARTSLRSSLWVRRSGRWQLSFHQGTPVPDEAPP